MIRFNADWLECFSQYNKLVIGFSGGLDSTVLLHLLANQQPAFTEKLQAVHVNHGLSVNALHWQNHCQQVCTALGIPLIIKPVKLANQANLENEARIVRYEAFASLLTSNDCLILGHHLDDQAETLLLQLFRGSGVDGLAAMATNSEFAGAQILRPLLEFSRQSLEDYAKAHQLRWIEDESNQNTSFSRNYLRHEVLPLIQARWPAVVNNLVRTTQHCQQAQSNLEALAKIDCPALNKRSPILDLASLNSLSLARVTNVLRFWLRLNKVKLPDTQNFNRLIHELIEAREDANPHVVWKGFSVRRYQQKLYLSQVKEEKILTPLSWPLFPQPLLIEGLGELKVEKAEQGFLLPAFSQIEVRFRQGGELFKWHGQSKELKKLLQDWQVPPWLRNRIPLLYVDGQLAAVVGFAVSDLFYGKREDNSTPLEFRLTL